MSAKSFHPRRAVLPVLACAFLTGCFDTRQEITLNPDGSGKAVLVSDFTPMDIFSASATTTNHQRARDTVRKYVEEAEGVEAWSAVSFGERDDGTVYFRGTAYFTNLSQFKAGVAPFLRFSATNDAAGQWTITTIQDTSQSPVGLPQTNEPVTAESIQRERRQFRSAKPWLAATLGVMKQETVLHVPGDIRRISNFQTNGPRSLRLRFDGARIMQLAEEALFDPETEKRLATGSPGNFLTNDHLLNEKLFGQKAPVLAVIQPDRRPTFDYAAEVAQARKEFHGIAQALALPRRLALSGNLPEPEVPATEGTPASVTVTGIQWNFAGERRLDGATGYTVSLLAKLPGAVLGVNKVRVDRAMTMEGADLISRKPPGYGLSLPGNGRSLDSVSFSVQLDSPAVDSKGLSELSGVLECKGMGNLRTVDLVSGTLSKGAKGPEFGAEIEQVALHGADGNKIVLRTSLAADQIRALNAVSDSGQTVGLEKRGTMAIGDERVHTFVSRRPLPRSGRLVAEVMTPDPSSMGTVRIPFSVTNVSLLGQPLAAK